MDWKVFGTAFLTLFLAELGDKTQLAVITMTANAESKLAVFAGASLALILVTLLGVIFGSLLTQFVPVEWLQRIVAIAFIFLLTYDTIMATRFPAPGGGTEFGIGVGTLLLALNVVLLGGYTFGCHSLRHLVGGVMDVMSNRPARRASYTCVSALNRGHMRWAWASLFVVGFCDVYIRLCAMGIWTDLRLV